MKGYIQKAFLTSLGTSSSTSSSTFSSELILSVKCLSLDKRFFFISIAFPFDALLFLFFCGITLSENNGIDDN